MSDDLATTAGRFRHIARKTFRFQGSSSLFFLWLAVAACFQIPSASGAVSSSYPFEINVNVADSDTLKNTPGLIPGGILVGKRDYHPPEGSGAIDTANYKAWLSIPFQDENFVEDHMLIPYRRTVSAVTLRLTLHADLHAINTTPLPSSGAITFNVYGLTNHARTPDPEADTWITIEGNSVSSAINLNTAKTTLLGSITLDTANLQPGSTVTLTGAALTEFVNTSLDYYFYTNKNQNTVPSGITLILTPATANTPAILFEREPLLSWEMRYFNGQVGSGSEHDVFDPAWDRPPIPGASPEFVGWATGVAELNRGYIQITDPTLTYTNNGNTSAKATFGRAEDALGASSAANPNNPYEVVSLGDGGHITLTFDKPITNGEGWDFAVFENGFIDYTNFNATESMAWLELAHVEVSSDGENFIRFPSISLTRPYNDANYAGGTGFATTPASTLHNLAGKYILGYGTPFDLDDLKDLPETQGESPLVNLDRITHVRVVDVVGINGNSVVASEIIGYDMVTGYPIYDYVYARDVPGLLEECASYDSEGNIITDPWPTPFWQGGFDLDAVGVRHQLHESTTWAIWRTENFNAAELEDASVSGPYADPDQDGIPNLVEYALSGGPFTQSVGILPASGLSEDGRLTLTFFRQRDDITYTVQGSDDLQTWTTVAVNPGKVAQRVTVTDNASAGASPRFLRLHVSNGVDETHTVPEGLLATTIAGGATAAFSIPLDRAPVARGPVTGVGASSVTVASAGAWADPVLDEGIPGENSLETPTLENPIIRRYTPFALRFLTGNLSGATFFIDTVSGNTVNLVTYGVDLTALMQPGDIYTVIPLHTLGSLFGEDEVSFQTGATASVADNIQLWNGNAWIPFFHDGNASWRRTGSRLVQNTTVFLPDGAFIITRRNATPLMLRIIGRIRDTDSRIYVKPSVGSFIAMPNLTVLTIGQTAIDQLVGWRTGTNTASADAVQLWSDTAWIPFFHDGSYWRRTGSRLTQNDQLIPLSTGIFFSPRPSASTQQSFLHVPLTFLP
ncbi:secretion protein [Opitutaceae bacterium TAV5]|nr:secretion protein [Opitutaceae bacterium TAV5]